MAIVTVGFNPAIDRILECPDFHVGGHQQARQIARLASGKAANVSRALAQVSVDSIATGFIGKEELDFFHEELLGSAELAVSCAILSKWPEKPAKTLRFWTPNAVAGGGAWKPTSAMWALQ